MEGHRQVSQYGQISNFDNNGKLNKKTTIGNVINDVDLNDDERNHNKDCIFVKSEKNLMPRICKSEKKVGKNIDAVSVQCVDDYDDDNDEITIVTAKTPLVPKLSATNKRKRILFSGPSVFEAVESSGSKSTSNVEVEVYL